MRLATRLISILIVPLAGGLAAQQQPPTGAPASGALVETLQVPGTVDERPVDRFDVKDRLSSVLRQHPWHVVRVVALDPSMLANGSYVARYPALERFLAEHPEVRNDPNFYAAGLEGWQVHRSDFDQFLEAAMIFVVFLLIALALAWLLRTIIEQKRWNRLSQTQTEVHNKILDRFTATDELLEYIRTPAGARFLESAPIPLHEARPIQDPPVVRVMWSIQIGLVAAAVAIGMLLVSYRYEGETAEGLFGLGVVLFFLGLGFVASAAVSIVLSRRVGLFAPAQESAPAPSDRFLDSGHVK